MGWQEYLPREAGEGGGRVTEEEVVADDMVLAGVEDKTGTVVVSCWSLDVVTGIEDELVWALLVKDSVGDKVGAIATEKSMVCMSWLLTMCLQVLTKFLIKWKENDLTTV